MSQAIGIPFFDAVEVKESIEPDAALPKSAVVRTKRVSPHVAPETCPSVDDEGLGCIVRGDHTKCMFPTIDAIARLISDVVKGSATREFVKERLQQLIEHPGHETNTNEIRDPYVQALCDEFLVRERAKHAAKAFEPVECQFTTESNPSKVFVTLPDGRKVSVATLFIVQHAVYSGDDAKGQPVVTFTGTLATTSELVP